MAIKKYDRVRFNTRLFPSVFQIVADYADSMGMDKTTALSHIILEWSHLVGFPASAGTSDGQISGQN